tara:strand:- start:146 stop:409 length:264 start_codon:yes stop_codon:yes gene_type:complete
MITWVKPSGLQIETNDMKTTVAYCKSLGWEIISNDAECNDPDAPLFPPYERYTKAEITAEIERREGSPVGGDNKKSDLIGYLEALDE